LLPVMVHAETPGDQDQPRRELAAAVGYKDAQSPKVIVAELIEDERVVIHRLVVTGRCPMGGMEQELAVLLQKRRPGGVALG
jgi:hypothetical protein